MTEREIFTAALNKKDPAERAAFLDEACAGDAPLRQRVESLLTEHQELGSFMDAPSPGVTTDGSSTELPGAVIGPYKLLEQIGEGGMGVVFMAEQQEPVRRKVALKLIKPGMDTRQIIARFEAERQALAVMDHPSIARVLDAGATESGRPYFVMELVRGVPITTYCDENNLSVRERLELFASVCQAIQHAHTKGIIHRDIKPTNVLVTRQDGRPVVKVIDFGVAKAMGQQLTEKTLFTNFAQMIGTPLYMSPEQAEQSGVDIDTRSDIYSLGVLLYELLTGSTPVNEEQMKKAAFDEIRRIIREDEPQTPSARISGSHTLPAIAAHRHIEPARLSRLVRGELDWIVMKALEKDRNRRYETANAFAADLLHYLNDEPVLACPPSATYRFGKFARRNRVAITTATLVTVALVLGTIVSTWQAIRAETARKAEVEQRQIAEAARAAESEQRKVAEAERSEAERQREQAEANFHRARETVDDYFTLVSESTLLDVPGVQALRKDLLDKALEFYKKTSAERTDDPAALADVALAYLRVAQMDHAIGRNDDCALAISSGLDIVDRLRRDYPHAVEHHRRLAGFWKGYRPGETRTEAPKNPLAAFKTLERAIATWQELSDTYPEQSGFRSDLASMCYLTARLLEGPNERGSLRYDERSKILLEKLVAVQPDVPQHQADLARTYQAMIRQLSLAGQPAEAEAAAIRSLSLREALATESPDIPQYRSELALILSQRAGAIAKQQPAEAEKMFQRAVHLSLGLVREFPDVFINYQVLGQNLRDWATYVAVHGSPEQQEQFERTAKDFIGQAADASMGAKVHFIREELALARRNVAKAGLGDPEKLHLQALVDLDELAKVFPKEPNYVSMAGHSYRYLGWIARDAGRTDDAIDRFEAGVAAFQKLVDANHPRDAEYRHTLAETLKELGLDLAASGKVQEAEDAYRRAVEAYELFLRDHGESGNYQKKAATAGMTRSYANVIEVLLAQDKHAEAEETIRQAIDQFDKLAAAHPAVPDYRRSRAVFQRRLAQLLASDNRPEEAGKTYQEAINSYEKVIADFPEYEDLWRVYDGLAQALAASNRPREADEARRKMVELAPNNAGTLNNLAWGFATAADAGARNASLAVELATKGIELDSANVVLPNTLGVAYYRAGNWQDAIEWLTKSMELRKGGDSFDWFFLAMAHWQLGNKDEARKWHAKAVEWMDANKPHDQQLLRFRAEAEELIKKETADQ